MILWSIPQMSPELVDSGSMMADDRYNEIGTYDLTGGPYSVWIEDYRAEDECDFYRAKFTDEDRALVPDRPPEQTREIEGVECELLAVFGGEFEGTYTLWIDLKQEATPGPNREVRVFFMESPGTETEAILVVGILLLIIGSLMAVIAKLLVGPPSDET